MRRILTLLIALVAPLSLAAATSASAQDKDADNADIICSYDAYNCSDFSSCAQVMRVFRACETDVHGLDRDKDGVPCDSLCN